MAGTKAGGAKAKQTNYAKYGDDFYQKIGSKGGKLGTTGGFYYAKLNFTEDDPRHPSTAGRRGGAISRIK